MSLVLTTTVVKMVASTAINNNKNSSSLNSCILLLRQSHNFTFNITVHWFNIVLQRSVRRYFPESFCDCSVFIRNDLPYCDMVIPYKFTWKRQLSSITLYVLRCWVCFIERETMIIVKVTRVIVTALQWVSEWSSFM